jgi:hypothetical protein
MHASRSSGYFDAKTSLRRWNDALPLALSTRSRRSGARPLQGNIMKSLDFAQLPQEKKSCADGG